MSVQNLLERGLLLPTSEENIGALAAYLYGMKATNREAFNNYVSIISSHWNRIEFTPPEAILAIVELEVAEPTEEVKSLAEPCTCTGNMACNNCPPTTEPVQDNEVLASIEPTVVEETVLEPVAEVVETVIDTPVEEEVVAEPTEDKPVKSKKVKSSPTL